MLGMITQFRRAVQLSVLLLSLGVLRGSPGGEADAHGLVVSGGFAHFCVGRDGACINVVRADFYSN